MAGLRERLRALLALPDVPRMPEATTFLVPEGTGPFPAILYAHAHGGDYDLGRDELTRGAHWLSAPFAPDLLRAGFAVLCVDMPGFGARVSEGTESALSKAGFWQGRPLFGQMVADQLAAFDWLAARPEIDGTRIATLGMSMGAALAMWTAAIQPRVAACAQLCMLADIGPLIAAGAHDRHGPYLTVPGLLTQGEIGDVAALIAPRPQFVAHGSDDALTPPAARDPALARLRAGYGGSTDLAIWLAEGGGHTETPEMRKAVLDFLDHALAEPETRKRETC